MANKALCESVPPPPLYLVGCSDRQSKFGRTRAVMSEIIITVPSVCHLQQTLYNVITRRASQVCARIENR